MSRLPIRARLTAVFVLVMAGLLAAAGLFLYYRTQSDVDAAINEALRARQTSLRASLATARPGTRDAIPAGENFAQVFALDGRLLASRPERAKPTLTPAEVRRGAVSTLSVQRREDTRFIFGPAQLHRTPVVAVVGASLDDRERALEGLAGALLIGGPLALLLAAAIGYATAAAALSPVESIRRRARGISRADPGAQVPVPPANDEIQRLALTLNEMLARLAEAAAHERSFVANASHELRTPLAALAVELELALRLDGSAAELRDAIRAAQADSARLSKLASNLLDLASADESAQLPGRDLIEIDALLGDVASELRSAVDESGRQLTIRPSALVVEADRLSLGRAVRNLADNALIHGAGAITMGADPTADNRARIWVHDQGALDEALGNGRAFERFLRGASAVDRPGAGLGLALVQAVARAHDGSAAILEPSAGGVCAWLTVPLAPSPLAALATGDCRPGLKPSKDQAADTDGQ